ncbi:MAG: zf-HC2 domain-containing protein [Candidatus Zixiibacteriota bacterium]
MSCKDLLSKLYEVIDNEATQADTAKVKEHIEACEKCMTKYQFEQMFKHFVTDKASTPETNDILKISILSQIDKIDNEANSSLEKSFRFKPVMLATAAAVLICVISFFSFGKYYRHKTAIEPYEYVHFNSDIDNGVIFASAIDMSKETDFIVNGLHLVFDDKMDDYSMLDVCSCAIKDVHLSHIRLMYENNYVSILIGKADEVNLPDFEEIEIDGMTLYQHTCKRCNMIYKIEGDAIIIAISKNNSLNLEPVVSSFRTI